MGGWDKSINKPSPIYHTFIHPPTRPPTYLGRKGHVNHTPREGFGKVLRVRQRHGDIVEVEDVEEGFVLLLDSTHKLGDSAYGWVGGWVGWKGGKEAVLMSYCELWAGWMDGGREGGSSELLYAWV